MAPSCHRLGSSRKRRSQKSGTATGPHLRPYRHRFQRSPPRVKEVISHLRTASYRSKHTTTANKGSVARFWPPVECHSLLAGRGACSSAKSPNSLRATALPGAGSLPPQLQRDTSDRWLLAGAPPISFGGTRPATTSPASYDGSIWLRPESVCSSLQERASTPAAW